MHYNDLFFNSDIDECLEGLDGCDQRCANTAGSYFCTCTDGYELESDNHTCTGTGRHYLSCIIIISLGGTTINLLPICLIVCRVSLLDMHVQGSSHNILILGFYYIVNILFFVVEPVLGSYYCVEPNVGLYFCGGPNIGL